MTADVIRAAIADPGRFTRRAERHTEPLTQWQTRAVMVALEQAGITLTSAPVTPEDTDA